MNRRDRENRNDCRAGAWKLFALVALVASWLGCGRGDNPSVANLNSTNVRGGQIQSVTPGTNRVGSTSNILSEVEMASLRARPDVVEDGFIRPGFDKLSAFKYELYEFYSETNAGRAMLASHDTIPPEIKAYDGKQVIVTGYILPMRTRRGVVTEFLLLRDQGTCCFGVQAQINHFMRVNFPPGIKPGDPVPWKVSGTIRVGEMYVQGYLTGIYQLDAESVIEMPHGEAASK
ncbi:MAG: DUF3299 domain-containing protein [Verrucomicrobia bacterium]|nr:DUF3299 domain-containing protein [Verrucomicrobiota bacterium]